MAYVKQNFVDGNKLYAAELNHIEDGISAIINDDVIEEGSTWSSTKTYLELGNKADTVVLNGTLSASGWTGEEAPYSKSVGVSGVLETDVPLIDMVATGTYSTDETIIEDWAKIYRIVATQNTLTFYATDTISTAIPFVVRCIR